MRKSRRPADGPKHSYCFLLSHSHKLQVRLVRAGSHCCLENLQSFSPHMLLSLGPRTLTLSNINALNDLQREKSRQDFYSIKRVRRKKHPPSKKVVVERPLFDDNAFTLGTERKIPWSAGLCWLPDNWEELVNCRSFQGRKNKQNDRTNSIQASLQ